MQTPQQLDLRLPLKFKSTPDLAGTYGEHIANLLELGDKPVATIQTALENKLGIMPLMLDADPRIAGVSLSLPEVGFICVNRCLPKNKRSIALAKGLFYLLTGDTLPYAESKISKKKTHQVEQLATNFVSSLLIPRKTVTKIRHTDTKQATTRWLVKTASELGVSAQALQLRSKQIEACTGRNLSAKLDTLDCSKLEPKITDGKLPQPFSKKYVELVAKAVDEPLTSGMSATHILGCKTFYEAGDLFAAYGVTAPETMEFAMPKYRKWKKLFP